MPHHTEACKSGAEPCSVVRKNLAEGEHITKYELCSAQCVTAGPARMMRWTSSPGWKWSQHVGPTLGTPSCTKEHRLFVEKGSLSVKMDKDGSEFTLKPGDVAFVPAGHDSWVVGNEECTVLDF